MVNDIIADTLTRIRNAQAVCQPLVDVLYSTVVLKILQILLKEGFILDFKKIRKKNQKFLRVYLKYDAQGRAAISGLKRVSKPGARVYKKSKELLPVRNGYGIAIVTTSKGIMTDRQARKENIGGEVLCEIW